MGSEVLQNTGFPASQDTTSDKMHPIK